jgi:hypothetical protein
VETACLQGLTHHQLSQPWHTLVLGPRHSCSSTCSMLTHAALETINTSSTLAKQKEHSLGLSDGRHNHCPSGYGDSCGPQAPLEIGRRHPTVHVPGPRTRATQTLSSRFRTSAVCSLGQKTGVAKSWQLARCKLAHLACQPRSFSNCNP